MPQAVAGNGADGNPDKDSDDRWLNDESTSQRGAQSKPGRRRVLALLGLVGAGLLVLWLRMVAGEPALPINLRLLDDGRILLQSATVTGLEARLGQTVHTLVAAEGQRLRVEPPLLARSARVEVDDKERERQLLVREQLAAALQQPELHLAFEDGSQTPVRPQPRGLTGLGLGCWLFGTLALALYGAAAVVLLRRPTVDAALYGLLVCAEAVNLLLIGVDTLPGTGMPTGFALADLQVRLLADTLAGGALEHLLLRYPSAHPQHRQLAMLLWPALLALAAVLTLARPAGLWWWAQGLLLLCGALAVAALRQAQARSAHPLIAVLQRLTLAGLGTLLLLSAAVALAHRTDLPPPLVAMVGSAVWHVFFASLLMLAPFLWRSRQVLREFALLAGVATVASSLNLLFIAGLGIGHAAAVTLALAAGVLLYLGARHWALAQLIGTGGPSAERMFEHLYRAARELEQAPGRAGEQLAGLLREVFDPLELSRSRRQASRIRVAVDGSTLVVPVPELGGPAHSASGTIVLRYAHRGRRLFTREDTQLTERVIEQLRRAVAYDRAVEQGRHEERTRIAQDLHDDIGARLLTLMYKAQDPEIEEYIRHTLQDLKTLTRGLAAGNYRLSHAAAEWKSDITQRLNATGCDLHWSFTSDRDLTLNVVQWSGLTRVLRELVNNIITHAQATQVEVVLQLEADELLLSVSDDGQGAQPEAWKHGLGLGGVRKRVKLLGGQVQWQARQPRGIRCTVRAPLGDARR